MWGDKYMQNFGREISWKRGYQERDGRIILEQILEDFVRLR
jgi:hypothetical protein